MAIEPRKEDEGRIVVLGHDEDRGTLIEANYFPPGEFSNLFGTQQQGVTSMWCRVRYSHGIYSVPKANLSWEKDFLKRG